MNAIIVVGSPSWYQTLLDPHASAAMDSNPVFTNPVFSNNSPRSTSSSSVSSGFPDEPRQASRTAVDIVQTVMHTDNMVSTMQQSDGYVLVTTFLFLLVGITSLFTGNASGAHGAYVYMSWNYLTYFM
jgi:hypothetical protein